MRAFWLSSATAGVTALATAVALAPAALAAPPAAAPAAALVEHRVQLPLSFEQNRGQSDARVQFLARSQGAVVFLTAQGAVIKTPQGVARMQFAGARAQTDLQGVTPDRAPVTYLSRQQALTVPSFNEVRFRQLYPDVDVLYYGRQNRFEYDLQLGAHANPSQIRLQFPGSAPTLAANGGLNVAPGVTLAHPVAYQTIAGQRRAVAVRYALHADHSAGFALGRYDHSQALVIDPVLVFSTYLGGTQFNQATAIAADSAGNAYLTGSTQSSDFPNPGSYSYGAYLAQRDVFVAKIAPDGKSLVYTAYLAASGDDEGNAIAVDAAGEAVVAGITNSPNFPATIGAFKGGYDGFVTKLNPAGTALVYSALLGGSSDDGFNAIAVDAAGDAVVAGNSSSTDYRTTAGAPQTTLQGQESAVVTALNPAGATVYSTYLGGAGVTLASGVALDSSGNAVVVGSTSSSTGFPITPAAFQSTYGGGQYDGFVAKLSSVGTLQFASYLGGSKRDRLNAVAVDAAGNAFITGDTQSALITAFPTNSRLTGTQNAIVAEVSRDGSTLVYALYVGGSNQDSGTAIVVDPTDTAYVAGYTNSPDFPNVGAFQANLAGQNDAFLARVINAGSSAQSVNYATFLGGSSNDQATGLAIDGNGDLFLTGWTVSGNFPVTAGVVQGSQNSSSDAFVAKFIAAPQGVFSPALLGFPAQATGVGSTSEAVVFTNNGEKPLVISKIALTGPYSETDNCSANSSTLQPSAFCTINVVFTPTAAGTQNGTLTISDNAPSGSQSIPLEGTGGDFSISVTPSTGTVTAGSSAAFSVELTPAAGYTGVVALTCTGNPLPPNSTCTASPTSLTMNGNSASTAAYTVTTTVRPSLVPPGPTLPSGPWTWLLISGLALGLLGVLYAAMSKTLGRARRRLGWAGAALLLGGALVAAGCGGASSNPGTAAGNYTLTFTGTASGSSKATHSTTAVLTVN